MSRLQKANAILDAACKRAGVDPIAMRIQMAKTIKDARERQNNGSGYSRQGSNRKMVTRAELLEEYPMVEES